MLLCLCDIAERLGREPEIVPGLVIARVERRGPAEGLCGLDMSTLLVIHATETVRDLRIRWRARRRTLERFFGFGIASEEVECLRLDLQRRNVLRAVSRDAIEGSDCVCRPRHEELRLAEREEERRARTACRDGARELQRGLIVAPRLVVLPRERLHLLAVLARHENQDEREDHRGHSRKTTPDGSLERNCQPPTPNSQLPT